MSTRYGVPYMGSKNDIAVQIIEHLPQARNFYDLFAGGCAVTHAAMVSGKFRNFICNDLQGMGVQLFINSIEGRYANENRWISREDFFRLKSTDPYVALCWSFGNNMRDYMYSVVVEEWKYALHNTYFFGDMQLLWAMGINPTGDTRKWLKTHENECKDKYIRWYFESKSMPVPTDEDRQNTEQLLNATKAQALEFLQRAFRVSGLRPKDINEYTGTQMFGHWFTPCQWQFPTPDMYAKLCEIIPTLPSANSYEYVYLTQRLQRLQSLQRLQRLQRLQSLQSLQRLQSLQGLQGLQKSYDQVEIQPNSVIYCDPPYQGTAQYITGSFGHANFWTWCRQQRELVVVSEYNAPDDFVQVAKFTHKSKLQGGMKNVGTNTEQLFVRRDQLHLLHNGKLFAL